MIRVVSQTMKVITTYNLSMERMLNGRSLNTERVYCTVYSRCKLNNLSLKYATLAIHFHETPIYLSSVFKKTVIVYVQGVYACTLYKQQRCTFVWSLDVSYDHCLQLPTHTAYINVRATFIQLYKNISIQLYKYSDPLLSGHLPLVPDCCK